MPSELDFSKKVPHPNVQCTLYSFKIPWPGNIEYPAKWNLKAYCTERFSFSKWSIPTNIGSVCFNEAPRPGVTGHIHTDKMFIVIRIQSYLAHTLSSTDILGRHSLEAVDLINSHVPAR